MFHISRWQKILVLSLLALGFLFTLPNFLPENVRAELPRWLPSSAINLGLDLQGGSYLLLEVDMPGVVTERLETMRARRPRRSSAASASTSPGSICRATPSI